jgi:uncharacterized membrane protein YsdA (DUF1294 family)
MTRSNGSNATRAWGWLGVLIALPVAAAWSLRERVPPEWCALQLVISLLSFCAYAWDKRCAQRGRARLPELQLLTLDSLGGWPGGWLAQQILRHKTNKGHYQLLFWIIVAAHEAVAMWLLWD